MTTVVSAQHEFQLQVLKYADDGLDNREICNALERDHPGLVDRYVAEQRRELIHRAVWSVVAHSNRQRRRRARLADVSEQHAAGESLLHNSYPSADGGRKILAKMNRADLLYSADLDVTQATGLISTADFKRAVAKKLSGGKVVEDVFTPEQIAVIAAKRGMEL